MVSGLFRRSLTAAGLAVLATTASPLVGLASAATFSGTIASQPAPDSSGVVAANRPTFKATFTAKLYSTSSISVSAAGITISCPKTVSGSVVSCTPSADLVDGGTYTVRAHGVSYSDHSVVANAPAQTYTIDYPSFDAANSKPHPGSTVVSGTEALTAVFDQAVAAGTAPAFEVFNAVTSDPSRPGCTVSTPCRGTEQAGTVSFPTTGFPTAHPGNTVVFTPTAALAPGYYEALARVVAVDGSGTAEPAAHGTAHYYFWVDGDAPADLTTDGGWVNSSNNTAVNFHGTAPVGETVTVTVPDSRVPDGANDATGSTTVADCAGHTSCPWTATLDLSKLPTNTYQWNAVGSDGTVKTAATSSQDAQDVHIDVTAPNAPTFGATTVTQKSGPDSTILGLAVSPGKDATGTADGDVVGYVATVTDADGHSITRDLGTTADKQQVDATSLDDGQLTISAYAVDAAGNQGASGTAASVTKHAGLRLDEAASSFATPSAPVTFTSAATRPIQPPTSVSLSFTQPVRTSWTDNTNPLAPVTHNAQVCFVDASGACHATDSFATTNGDRTLVVNVPARLADGNYTLYVDVFSKNLCPDTDPLTGAQSCEAYAQTVPAPGSSSPLRVTIDGTAPAAPTVQMPSSIGASNVGAVTISGTGEPGTSILLTLKSSGGGSTYLAGHGAPITVAPTGAWSTTEDLSAVPDGTLTVKATDRDAAGNRTTTTVDPAPVLRAHVSALTATVSRTTVTYTYGLLVSGRLTDAATHAGVANQTITITPRYDDGTTGTAQTARTGSDGSWAVVEFPDHNVTYLARFAGSTAPVQDAVSASTAHVGVRVDIAIISPRNGATVGSPVTLTGRVGPAKPGAQVLIYRHTASGNRLIGKTTLSAKSLFTFRLTLPRGRTTVYAAIGRTAGNLGNRSAMVTLLH